MPFAPKVIKVKDIKTRPSYLKRYGKEWPRIRKAHLQQHPFCEACGVFADTVHHVNADRLDNHPGNLQSMCRSCHSKLEKVK